MRGRALVGVEDDARAGDEAVTIDRDVAEGLHRPGVGDGDGARGSGLSGRDDLKATAGAAQAVDAQMRADGHRFEAVTRQERWNGGRKAHVRQRPRFDRTAGFSGHGQTVVAAQLGGGAGEFRDSREHRARRVFHEAHGRGELRRAGGDEVAVRGAHANDGVGEERAVELTHSLRPEQHRAVRVDERERGEALEAGSDHQQVAEHRDFTGVADEGGDGADDRRVGVGEVDHRERGLALADHLDARQVCALQRHVGATPDARHATRRVRRQEVGAAQERGRAAIERDQRDRSQDAAVEHLGWRQPGVDVRGLEHDAPATGEIDVDDVGPAELLGRPRLTVAARRVLGDGPGERQLGIDEAALEARNPAVGVLHFDVGGPEAARRRRYFDGPQRLHHHVGRGDAVEAHGGAALVAAADDADARTAREWAGGRLHQRSTQHRHVDERSGHRVFETVGVHHGHERGALEVGGRHRGQGLRIDPGHLSRFLRAEEQARALLEVAAVHRDLRATGNRALLRRDAREVRRWVG